MRNVLPPPSRRSSPSFGGRKFTNPCYKSCRIDRTQSFLAGQAETLGEPQPAKARCLSTWCCCIQGLFHVVVRSAPFVIGWVIVKALLCSKWIYICLRQNVPTRRPTGRRIRPLDEKSGGGGQEHGAGTDFIVVEFNAWE